jgi:hypothetical protein
VWNLVTPREHRLRVYENKVLRRVFGPKRGEVVRGWRRLHNEGIKNVHLTIFHLQKLRQEELLKTLKVINHELSRYRNWHDSVIIREEEFH